MRNADTLCYLSNTLKPISLNFANLVGVFLDNRIESIEYSEVTNGKVNRLTMNVLFIIPPQILKNSEGVDSAANVSIPLGPLYMAAYLKKMDFQGGPQYI